MIAQSVRFDDFGALEALTGTDFGDWGSALEITQDMVDRFADLSGDHQWIHVDPEKARRESPFGGPVAHGMLVLSVIPSIMPANRWVVTGHGTAVNYGSDGLRFVSPVPVGMRIHARSRLAAVARHAKGTMITIEIAVHGVGNEKPAMLYRAQVLYIGKPA
ncbi:MaoC family dehydratase [Sphingomonas sp. KC8]|uniref:MaoC family dehydratase n=1 Tax=Sphingomonas sp. KC8 TaxID=1030157 RepID=UPI0002488518|nr:MaoC family dehydratase [Sphingomonas sp. KC8]ARS26713.1 hypothetical protein KC8_05350 [Sphingomonas sp. KC8]